MLQRCEKLEAKVLHFKNNPIAGAASDGTKPLQVQVRNSSLVDKLKASNAIASVAMAGNGN